MKIQESAENYLESILIIKKEKGAVRSVDIANHLGFSKASVSVAMKNLKENGFIRIDSDGLIHLNESGLKIADSIFEKHTIITEWLVSLGVSLDTAAEDACKIEHVISNESFEALKRHLNGF